MSKVVVNNIEHMARAKVGKDIIENATYYSYDRAEIKESVCFKSKFEQWWLNILSPFWIVKR